MVSLKPARLLAAASSVAVHFFLRLFFGTEPFVRPLLWASAFAFVMLLVGSMLIEDSLAVLHGARRWIVTFGSTALIAIDVWHNLRVAVKRKRKLLKRRHLKERFKNGRGNQTCSVTAGSGAICGRGVNPNVSAEPINMNAPSMAKPEEKLPVRLFKYPTRKGPKKPPRFPMPLINPTTDPAIFREKTSVGIAQKGPSGAKAPTAARHTKA